MLLNIKKEIIKLDIQYATYRRVTKILNQIKYKCFGQNRWFKHECNLEQMQTYFQDS